VVSESRQRGHRAIVDDRITALAKMIRSDNKTLPTSSTSPRNNRPQAGQPRREGAGRHLPAQVTELIDRRFSELEEKLHGETQSTMVAVAKVADVMSQRMDDVESRYTEGVDRAAERLGDAVANALERSRA